MRIKKGIFALAVLGAIAAAPAVSHANVIRGIGTYFADRGNDLLDIVRFRVGAPRDGKAIGIKARATSLVQLGYVSFDGTYVGLDRRGVGIVDERRREAGASLFYGSYNNMEARWGNHFLKGDTMWSDAQDRRILRNLPHWDDGRQRPLSLGAEVATPLFGVDAGVYPEEALDFVLGFFAIDIFSDDQLLGQKVPDAEATTPAVPNVEAPFEEKRVKNKMFKAEMERKAAQDALRQAEAANGTAAPETESMAVEPEVAPAPASHGDLNTITEKAADDAMKQVPPAPAVPSPVPAPAPAPVTPSAGPATNQEKPGNNAAPDATNKDVENDKETPEGKG